MTKKNEKQNIEPQQIYVDSVAIEKEKAALENYLSFINKFAENLEKDGISLNEGLLEQFSQEGPKVITNGIMSGVEAKGDLRLLSPELREGAARIATTYSQTFVNLQNIQFKTGLDLSFITLLKGKAIAREGVLDEITRRNTVYLTSSENSELHERLVKFAESFNELKAYIKESHPECENLADAITIGINENHYFMGKIDREDCYLVNVPETDSDLAVNPLYFKGLK